MKLFEIAFACYIYGQMSDYDSSYCDFLKATNHKPDIKIAEHRIELLKWLNKWGCRQFAKNYHRLASEEIRTWYEQFNGLLFPTRKTLLELSDDEAAVASKAYADLAERKASKRNTKSGGKSDVMIGPTGAAKILFAIRPNALPPWDDPIRPRLKLDGSAKSYVSYLGIVKREIEELGKACERNGYSLLDLPKLVDKPTSSLAKLIDEYFWVTISRKCPAPASDSLARWATWQ